MRPIEYRVDMEGSTEYIAGSSFQSSIRVELWIRVDLLTH